MVAIASLSPGGRRTNNYRFAAAVFLSVCALALVLLTSEQDANTVYEVTANSNTGAGAPGKGEQDADTMFSEDSRDLAGAATQALSTGSPPGATVSSPATAAAATASAQTATEEQRVVAKASDAAVQGVMDRTLSDMAKHPISAFGKVAEDAATDSFEESYINERIGLALNHTGAKGAAPVDLKFQPGDLPIPEPLKADGKAPIPWETRLMWAQTNCVKVRAAAQSVCKQGEGDTKAACADKQQPSVVKHCVQVTTTAQEKCHTEHHQAFRTCSALWNAARTHHEEGESIEVREAMFTQHDIQMHQAQLECGKGFKKQQTECAAAHDKAHEACADLQKDIATAIDSSFAWEQAQQGCAKAARHADTTCTQGHEAVTKSCDTLYKQAKAVAMPELAAVMSDLASSTMSKAVKQCQAERQGAHDTCRSQAVVAYNACRQHATECADEHGAKNVKDPCCKAVTQAQGVCTTRHSRAHEHCKKAYTDAQNKNDALVDKLSAAASKTAGDVAKEAKALGIPRYTAEHAVLKAAQQAMIAVAQGRQPATVLTYHKGALKTARESIRTKMQQVVAGVRKVWKGKVASAVKKAASAAAAKARKQGLSANDAKQAAIKAAKASATHLKQLAQEAELKAGAKVMGPEVEKLVSSNAEKDYRRFKAMAQPYLQRADELLKHMDEAEAELEAKKAKEKAAQEAKDASTRKAQDKELAHKQYLKGADQRLKNTTMAVAGAGEEVSKTLAQIAKDAAMAAQEVQHTEMTVDVAALPAAATTPATDA